MRHEAVLKYSKNNPHGKCPCVACGQPTLAHIISQIEGHRSITAMCPGCQTVKTDEETKLFITSE